MYSQDYFKSLSKEERLRILRDNNDLVEEREFIRPASEDELLLEREKLAEASIDLSVLEERFKEVKKQHKDETKPFKTTIEGITNILKLKGYYQTGEVFDFFTQDGLKIESYDTEGTLISVRDAKTGDKGRRTLKFDQKESE